MILVWGGLTTSLNAESCALPHLVGVGHRPKHLKHVSAFVAETLKTEFWSAGVLRDPGMGVA